MVIRAWTFMQCIVIIVLKIEPAGQVRYNKQQLNSQRRAKHVRNTIEMKSYPSLNSDTGCSNGWSSICDLFVAWALDVRDLLFLHSYIGRTPFSYPCVLCKKVHPIRAKIRYPDLHLGTWCLTSPSYCNVFGVHLHYRSVV